jgi:hypothetical protein
MILNFDLSLGIVENTLDSIWSFDRFSFTGPPSPTRQEVGSSRVGSGPQGPSEIGLGRG